ncbi:hypothetical protein I8752_05315 [Nostocaceae cyanobacterium CENA369]|uniref:Uncharacterized protein n=1 Tax=Dendronalium phyllosphericum CENA369 TaxID=1725256 RepID=A0A8J7I1V6_9NOST|nr:hypothetical protein [Dendronalium phyllosphericum]MBH8572463.1 hypothetical protein [Dendronalium phyllosphericum CENA369]
MAVNLVNTKISTQVLHFKPGGSPVSFEVSVVNESNQFASFQLEIIAAGGSSIGSNWYNISPAVSAKNPPGDTTKFYITITDTPVAGFIGKMNLIVRIFSLELRDEDRQLLRLVVEAGTSSVPMRVELPVREFSTQPQTLIEIPVLVLNPSQISTSVSLRFCGLKPQWLVDGGERLLQVPPGAKVETSFLCQLPAAEEVPSQAYPFTIEATHLNGLPSRSPEGLIKVLPGGFINFQCIPEKQRIPVSRPWLPQWRTNSAIYHLECQNFSNLSQQIQVEVSKGEEEQPKCFLDIQPEIIDINPGETKHSQLLVSKRRRWFGLAQKFSFIVKAFASDSRLNINNENQFLKLTIHPIIHPWLQLILGILLLRILWMVSWLNPANPLFGHHSSVTSVQFNGVGDRAISGSQDQSIIRWNIAGFTNPLINQQHGKIAKNLGKAIRVVRYKPVNNDVVAAGLENGEIQLWSVLSGTKKSIATFTLNKSDRVLALEFSPDSRFLFSGHGSGSVLQWDANNALLENAPIITKPIKSQDVKFSVYGLALVGQDRQNLVVGGRYNNLAVWNLTQNKLWKIPYNPPGSQNDYIVSLDSAEYRPNLLATSDNNGQITLWNMQSCLNNQKAQCQVLDKWSDGHGGKAVRSVAISNNGCYLASGGDDNRVMLWPLTKEGRRALPNGIQVHSASQRFNSVDIKVVKDKILIISGNDNTEVMVDIRDLDKNSYCKIQ